MLQKRCLDIMQSHKFPFQKLGQMRTKGIKKFKSYNIQTIIWNSSLTELFYTTSTVEVDFKCVYCKMKAKVKFLLCLIKHHKLERGGMAPLDTRRWLVMSVTARPLSP
jgi:hypothetical protein